MSAYRFRLAALNEEIREADMTLHDDTFNDVVQVESLFKFDLLNFSLCRAGVQQDGLHSPGEASKEIASRLRRFARRLHLHPHPRGHCAESNGNLNSRLLSRMIFREGFQ